MAAQPQLQTCDFIACCDAGPWLDMNPQSCLPLQVYAQRLGCDLNRPAAVSRTLGDAFLLVSEALADPGLLQFPPSVAAAAVLVAARKAQVTLALNPHRTLTLTLTLPCSSSRPPSPPPPSSSPPAKPR